MSSLLASVLAPMLPLALALAAVGAPQAMQHELVIAGGRVMDPESGLDAVRHVAVTDGRIVAIQRKASRR